MSARRSGPFENPEWNEVWRLGRAEGISLAWRGAVPLAAFLGYVLGAMTAGWFR